MPAVQPQPTPPARPELHRYRQMAESFGVDPGRYDRARPRYPDALIERVAAASPGPDVLDVGCGTGIAARQFRAAGCRVLGVEPDARMAGFAARSGIEVDHGDASRRGLRIGPVRGHRGTGGAVRLRQARTLSCHSPGMGPFRQV